MSNVFGNLIGVLILVLMATFIGIWFWAWRKRHQPVFDRMARLPMEDDALPREDDVENKK
jgi:cytochrome c oxidase cbb3-type subunit 4